MRGVSEETTMVMRYMKTRTTLLGIVIVDAVKLYSNSAVDWQV